MENFKRIKKEFSFSFTCINKKNFYLDKLSLEKKEKLFNV